MEDSLSEFFDEFGDPSLGGDDLFAILESLDAFTEILSFEEAAVVSTKEKEGSMTSRLVSQKSSNSSSIGKDYSETHDNHQLEASPKIKRQKLDVNPSEEGNMDSMEGRMDCQQRISHITVERKRRKQMNEHLSVLRSLMPGFYVKRGDQASIIGGVIHYINELQQVLQSLEAKKHRKVYSEVLSPRIISSPRPSPLSPRKLPLSPRLNLPISPGTPQPSSPYRSRLQQNGYLSPTVATSIEPSPSSSSATYSTVLHDAVNELAANSKSAIADVEVKFSGANLVLKTVSTRIPGQALKIISTLEELSLEILHASISTAEETMINSFTVKIGIECKLSAEELAHQIQQTFC